MNKRQYQSRIKKNTKERLAIKNKIFMLQQKIEPMLLKLDTLKSRYRYLVDELQKTEEYGDREQLK